ncbi:2-dehydro-3-deoxygalactonokinase [Photobacterium marinum]|uniref:2-dehydro-3-deoxygalactonokinase n=2 Tax=Photobacterium marinum TaxID=1056511 RepID=L8J362_9GAMM|nr:2-dehydro-3-deoxygalactonokinase [Photobacterium marinum]
MSTDGSVLDKISASQGLLAVTSGEFPTVLHQLLAPWHHCGDSLPLLLGGMVGSQQGWREAPYVSVPASVASLSEKLVLVELGNGQSGWIVPGFSAINQAGLPDVMRGEELQLLGLAALAPTPRLRAILPGTHSKHAVLCGDVVQSFNTFMTGELFSLLKHHSILGRQLPVQQPCQTSFLKGVDASLEGGLSQVLFSVRTLRLFEQIPIQAVESYLSGLLIGSELAALKGAGTPLFVVGDEGLCQWYLLAMEWLGVHAEFISGDRCFLVGMTQIYQQLKESRHVS